MPVPALSPITPAIPSVSAGMVTAETIRCLRQTQADFARFLAARRRVVEDIWEMLAAANDLLAKSRTPKSDGIG
jgi:hypothetical protein